MPPPVAKGENYWLGYATRTCAWMVLLAVGIDLAFLRGGAYLPTGIPGLHLPDLLFFLGALGGTAISLYIRYEQLRGVWLLTVGTTVYIAVQLVGSQVSGSSLYMAIRDLAPFMYLVALPGVTYLMSRTSGRQPVVIVRVATAVLASWVGAAFVGLDLASFGSDISRHLFSLNADVAGVGLALGVVVWGRQENLGGVPIVQMGIGVIGLLLQSRVAAVAVVAAGIITVLGQSDVRARLRALALALTTLLASVLLASVVPGQSENRWIDSPLPGLTRTVLPLERTSEGTLLARVDTWGDVLAYASEWPRIILGGGVGSDAFAAACGGICAVAGGVLDLRYPHNVELSLVLYQGVIGLSLFLTWVLVIGVRSYRRRPTALQWFGLSAYLIAAQFGVVLESPFGLVPWVFFAGWILSKPEKRSRVPMKD